MKKIAVFTDFSERSTNVAAYALSLAAHLHADLLLCNTFLVPSLEPMSAQIAWPMEDYEEIKTASENELSRLVAKLMAKHGEVLSNSFCPKIEYRALAGGFSLNADELLSDKELILVVIANHHRGFTGLMMGNHTREIIDRASLPVLVIPGVAGFKKLEKIVFATDLNQDDLAVIHSLAGLARPSGAEILLSHIGAETPENEKRVKNFLAEVTNLVNYPNIYYRPLLQLNIRLGLNQVAETFQGDLMVMVHREKDIFTRLFGGSHSLQMAGETKLPLLIFPGPSAHLPFF